MDEVYVKINGEMRYLWRAVDHEGEVLGSLVTKDRDKAAALKFIKRVMKRHGRPKAIVTDGLRSYGAALKALGGTERQHAELMPEHVRSKATLAPPSVVPQPRRRGRPPKSSYPAAVA